MPRLILFAPCSRAIVSADDGSVTLVALLDGIEATAGPDGAVSPIADLGWEVLAVWQADPGDEDQSFEHRIEIIRPDRSVAAEVRQPFSFTRNLVRVRGAIAGFPVQQSGAHSLRLSVRNVVDGEVWERVADYPVMVTHPSADSAATPQPEEAARAPRRRAGRRTTP